MLFLLVALSPKEIQKFFISVVELAEQLMSIHSAKQLQGINEPPVVTVSNLNNKHCVYLINSI